MDSKRKITFNEANNFISEYYYKKNTKEQEAYYHETIFKNLIKLIYNSEHRRTIKKTDKNEESSIYWLILLVFPLLKDKLTSSKIDLGYKYSSLYDLIVLIKGKEEIKLSDVKDIMNIYMKASLLAVFKSIYIESQNHILAPELKKDIDKKSSYVFVEPVVESYLRDNLYNKEQKMEEDRIIIEKDLHMLIPAEMLFFSELLSSFNEYATNVKSSK
jgi:hypothetical protein